MPLDLISVDDHVIEHARVWSDRLPQKHQEQGPRVIETDGREYWLFEDQRIDTMGLNAVAGKENKEFSMDPVRFDDMIPGCYDPVQRARDLLGDGVRGSLCFPTFPRFAGVRFLTAQDKELADACVRAYNDFMLDEWCASVPGMYIPMVIGQLWDPGSFADELRRCAARGARAVSFPESTHAIGLPSFHDRHWDPVWEAVTETDVVVCMHIGTSGQSRSPSPDASYATEIALSPINAQITLTDLLFSSIPQRFPSIKMAMSEGGIGWVPFALERADRTWEKHRFWAQLGDTKPSEVFRRNFWVCFIDEKLGVEARYHIGVDRILWECDYPHADTPWPKSQHDVSHALSGLPDEDIAAMTHGNAERLFRWDVRPDPATLLGNGAGPA
jgi:predicted TIM-barrel fold metal-dependent hydrolase